MTITAVLEYRTPRKTRPIFEWQLVGAQWHELPAAQRLAVISSIEGQTGAQVVRLKVGRQVIDSTPHIQKLTKAERHELIERLPGLLQPADSLRREQQAAEKEELKELTADRPSSATADFLRDLMKAVAGIKAAGRAPTCMILDGVHIDAETGELTSHL